MPKESTPVFQLLDLSTWEASQISMGRTCSTPMVRRVASLGLIADSWYSVAHDLPWSGGGSGCGHSCL